MKNNKKLFTAMLLSSVIAGSAHADVVIGSATDTFTWSGTVPAAPITNGIVITPVTSAALDNGKLTFNREGRLIGSTSINFKVQKIGGATGNDIEEFTAQDLADTGLSYTVLSFKADGSKSGLSDTLGGATQYYALKAGSVALQLNTKTKMSANNVQLSIDESLAAASTATVGMNYPILGEQVTVESVIMVEAGVI